MRRSRIEPTQANRALSLTRLTSRVLQRACSCAETGEAECDECKQKQPSVQRYSSGRNGGSIPPVVHEVLRSPGHSLDARSRVPLEQSLGYDFSGVRVHMDRRANESARAVNALAYTSGRDIVFGTGQYAPGTRSGNRLIAHELTHVAQQNGAGTAPPAGIDTDARAEREAETVANQAAHPQRKKFGEGLRESAAGSLQRQPAPGKTSDAFDDAVIADTTGCVQEFTGESIEGELKPGTVTVFDFGATWCNPCKALAGFMASECTKHKNDKKPMRFFAVDIDKNPKLNEKWAHGNVPQLYVFDGMTQAYHGTSVEPMDVYAKLFDGLATSKPAAAPEEKNKEDQMDQGSRGIPRLAQAAIFGGGGALTALSIFGGLALAGVKASAGVVGGVVGGVGALGVGLGLLDVFGLGTRTKGAGAPEADALIRDRFGKDIPAAGKGDKPLHNATIHPVTQAELRAFWKCRHPKEEPSENLVGWTDKGPEGSEDTKEPVCANGKKLEAASPEKPVIYWATDKADGAVLIHEGLHAYEDRDFELTVRNFISEGATQYFTQQVAENVNMVSSSGYNENQVKEVKKLVDVIGEDALRQAYFHGNFGPADAKLGKGGLVEWAHDMQMGSNHAADEILESAKKGSRK